MTVTGCGDSRPTTANSRPSGGVSTTSSTAGTAYDRYPDAIVLTGHS